MVIQLSDTEIRCGEIKKYSAGFGFDSIPWNGSQYRLTDRKDILISVENSGNGKYHVLTETSCMVHMPCDRCLKDVPCRIDIHAEREVDVSEDYESDDQDEQMFLHGYELDVDEFIRSELFLSIPMKVLCRDDCKGLCPKCGADLNKGKCGCEDGPLDPRMAAIQEIFRNANL